MILAKLYLQLPSYPDDSRVSNGLIFNLNLQIFITASNHFKIKTTHTQSFLSFMSGSQENPSKVFKYAIFLILFFGLMDHILADFK